MHRNVESKIRKKFTPWYVEIQFNLIAEFINRFKIAAINEFMYIGEYHIRIYELLTCRVGYDYL